MSFNEFVLDQCGKTWPELKNDALTENQDLAHEDILRNHFKTIPTFKK
ncbi:hypothetical protein [Bacillus thuringiensis]|nr:hypothetical protein [Bacillus thuringiensis]